MSTTSGFREDETHRVDAVLAEGLRRLDVGDSSGWRRLLSEHPERAADLLGHARRLQQFGFYAATAAPHKVGPYRLLQRLGHGGMGVVYRARAEGADVDRAVKLVRPERIDGELGRQRFRREVAASSSLQHPGIVRVLDVGIDDEVPWFAMELVDGPSLADLIAAARQDGGDSVARQFVARIGRSGARGGLRPWTRFVLDVLTQVLDAVQHAHERGVLHRDVKPSNVLVDGDCRAVLIDFGLARVTDATTITRSTDTLGSLPYMAPELLRSSGEAAVAGDVYGVGATLYHALGLQLPFVGANAEGVRHGILHTSPRPLTDLDPGLPRVLADVCGKAMAPEPQRRYASAAAFAADLRCVLDGRRPQARPPGRVLKLRRWMRRHPLRAVSLSAAFAFAAVLPTSLYWVQATELRKTTRLSDLHRIGEMKTAERALWPARPEVVVRADGMDAWLADADELLGRRDQHAADLSAVRARGRRMTEAELAVDPAWQRLQRALGELHVNMKEAVAMRLPGWDDWLAELREHEAPLLRRAEIALGVSFASDSEGRLFRNLAELVLGLEQLTAMRARVEARRTLADTLAKTSLEDAAEAWRTTLTAIADLHLCPQYRGLRMSPQFGLVPLGRDPQSGYFEFAHLASGKVPVRGADGRFTIGEDDGIVLVLLPGGRVRVGADLDPAGPHWDPGANAADSPSIEVRLDPFFIGKFEVTQAQWVRQRGHNNCMIKPGSRDGSVGTLVTAAHPVDCVAWTEVSRIAGEWGLVIPTGAQWEYAARAGTSGAHWCGESVAALAEAENLKSGDAMHGVAATAMREPHRAGDGWLAQAPVGRFRPNPFGLFDMLGNVRELTADVARPYAQALRDGDGCSSNVDSGTQRGCDANTLASECHVSMRSTVPPETPNAGLRVARRIEGVWTQD